MPTAGCHESQRQEFAAQFSKLEYEDRKLRQEIRKCCVDHDEKLERSCKWNEAALESCEKKLREELILIQNAFNAKHEDIRSAHSENNAEFQSGPSQQQLVETLKDLSASLKEEVQLYFLQNKAAHEEINVKIHVFL